MDLDWCLTCEKRVDGSSPYCSPHCQELANPDAHLCPHNLFNDSEDLNDPSDDLLEPPSHTEDLFSCNLNSWSKSFDISAWAATVPFGAPPIEHSKLNIPDDAASSTSLQGRCHPPPLLVKHRRRAVPPSLCVTTPKPAPPPLSTPITTPQRQISARSPAISGGNASLGNDSLPSAATESSIATPISSHPAPIAGSRKHSMLNSVYSHFRQWVAPPAAMLGHSQFHLQMDVAELVDMPPMKPVFPCHLPRGSPNAGRNRWMITNAPIIEPKIQSLSTGSQKRHANSYGAISAHTSSKRPDDHPSFISRGRKASRAVA